LSSNDPVEPLLGPEVLARLQGSALRASRVMHGRLQGIHRSAHQGASVEFSEHKEYSPGDELRHVDWRAVARFDHYFVKRFEHETNANSCIVLDGSGSMAYGANELLTKYEYGAVLATCLGLLLLRQQDAMGAVLFDDELRVEIPPRAGLDHLRHLTQAMDQHEPQGTTALEVALERAGFLTGKRGMIFVLSDCFLDPTALGDSLARLSAAGHQITVLQILDGDEIDLPFNGSVDFQGLETGHRLLVEPRAIRAHYKAQLAAHLLAVEEACLSARAQRYLVDTRSAPIEVIMGLVGRDASTRRLGR
jgi:uncharacterized protein (DUF58 family)